MTFRPLKNCVNCRNLDFPLRISTNQSNKKENYPFKTIFPTEKQGYQTIILQQPQIFSVIEGPVNNINTEEKETENLTTLQKAYDTKKSFENDNADAKVLHTITCDSAQVLGQKPQEPFHTIKPMLKNAKKLLPHCHSQSYQSPHISSYEPINNFKNFELLTNSLQEQYQFNSCYEHNMQENLKKTFPNMQKFCDNLTIDKPCSNWHQADSLNFYPSKDFYSLFVFEFIVV